MGENTAVHIQLLSREKCFLPQGSSLPEMGLGLHLRAFRQFLRMAELLDRRGSPEAAGLSEERRHPFLDCLVCFPAAMIRQPDKSGGSKRGSFQFPVQECLPSW